jgi:hypothetical protein
MTASKNNRSEGARMLTLNRNCPTVANRGSLFPNQILRGMVSSVIYLALSCASLVNAQAVGDESHLSAQESSILISDNDLNKPNVARPAQPSPSHRGFTARPQEQSLRPQVSRPAFEIPRSPTRDDFTNPDQKSGVVQPDEQVAGRSTAIGNFAHASSEPADPYAEPEPPAAPIRSFGSATVPVRVAQSSESNHSNQPARDYPPISRNNLRSSNGASPLSVSNGTTNVMIPDQDHVPHSEPAADAMTAASRFVDSRPAPPAAMPTTSPARFNPQIFTPQHNTNELRTQEQDQQQPNPNLLSQPAQPTQRMDRQSMPPMQVMGQLDNQVTATSFSQPIASEQPVDQNLAKLIVDRYSMDNAAEPLPGEPMKLKEMLQQPIPMQSRRPMVSQYWETWFDWAALQNAIAYQEWLATIPNASSSGEKGLLDAARSAAENQVLAAEIQMGKSQAKLIRFMPTRRSTLSPLPSDLPLVERYETHYELYKARNMMPTRLLGIDQMLPQTLKLINHRAVTVQKSQAAIKQTMAAYSKRQVPLASVLEAARVWQSAEQELLASVTNYNQAIADYAFNVTRRQTTPEQTVAMLIGAAKTKTNALPTTSGTASSSVLGNRQMSHGRNQNGTAGNFADTSFGQPTTGRTAATPTSFSGSSARSAASSSNETLAPTNRPAWNGGGNSSNRQALSTGSSRSTADARPSLGATSRNGFGGRNTSASSPSISPTAFGSLSTGAGSQPSAPSTKPFERPTAGSSGGRSSFGVQSNSNAINRFGGASSSASSRAASRPPSTSKPKPFPLPKRPKSSNNSFGGFGS